MTLAQIYRLALRQLGEDPADVSEFSDLFAVYANQGYKIAVDQYLKPKDTMTLRTDDKGDAYIDGMDIVRIIALRDGSGREVYAQMSEDGTTLHTGRKNAELTAVCVVTYPEMESELDEPRIPASAHSAIADYICFKYLSTGNMAKQSRAQHFRSEFYTSMQAMRPQASGGVTRFKNLYAVSDARWVR